VFPALLCIVDLGRAKGKRRAEIKILGLAHLAQPLHNIEHLLACQVNVAQMTQTIYDLFDYGQIKSNGDRRSV
jgi:hypothetical protein